MNRSLTRPRRPSEIEKIGLSEQIWTDFWRIVRIETISENSDKNTCSVRDLGKL